MKKITIAANWKMYLDEVGSIDFINKLNNFSITCMHKVSERLFKIRFKNWYAGLRSS